MNCVIINMEESEENAWFSATEPDSMHLSALNKLIIAQGLSDTKRERVCHKCTEYCKAALELRTLTLSGQTEITSEAFRQRLTGMQRIKNEVSLILSMFYHNHPARVREFEQQLHLAELTI